MKLHVLIGQRKESYEGEYGMEALAAASDADVDGNPEYLPDQLQKYRDSDEFDALAVVTLKVSGEAVRAALYPNLDPIKAVVVQPAG